MSKLEQGILDWLRNFKGESLEAAAISGVLADHLGSVVAQEMARQDIRAKDLKFDDWPTDLPGVEISAEEMAKR